LIFARRSRIREELWRCRFCADFLRSRECARGKREVLAKEGSGESSAAVTSSPNSRSEKGGMRDGEDSSSMGGEEQQT
jgi:hypothetical protein